MNKLPHLIISLNLKYFPTTCVFLFVNYYYYYYYYFFV